MEYKLGDKVRVLRPEKLKKEWYEKKINTFPDSKEYIEKIFKENPHIKNEWVIKYIEDTRNKFETKYNIENGIVRGYSVYEEEIEPIFSLPDHLFEI